MFYQTNRTTFGEQKVSETKYSGGLFSEQNHFNVALVLMSQFLESVVMGYENIPFCKVMTKCNWWYYDCILLGNDILHCCHKAQQVTCWSEKNRQQLMQNLHTWQSSWTSPLTQTHCSLPLMGPVLRETWGVCGVAVAESWPLVSANAGGTVNGTEW